MSLNLQAICAYLQTKKIVIRTPWHVEQSIIKLPPTEEADLRAKERQSRHPLAHLPTKRKKVTICAEKSTGAMNHGNTQST